jgi:hypothetical protein
MYSICKVFPFSSCRGNAAATDDRVRRVVDVAESGRAHSISRRYRGLRPLHTLSSALAAILSARANESTRTGLHTKIELLYLDFSQILSFFHNFDRVLRIEY